MLVAGATFMRKPMSAKSNDFFSIHVLLLFVCKFDQNPPIILREKSLTIYFEDSQLKRNMTFDFIVSNLYVDKRSRVR